MGHCMNTFMDEKYFTIQRKLEKNNKKPYLFLSADDEQQYIKKEKQELCNLYLSTENVEENVQINLRVPFEVDLKKIDEILTDEEIKGDFFEVLEELSHAKSDQLEFTTAKKTPIAKETSKNADDIQDNHLINKIESEILDKSSSITWDDIAGLENPKRIINEIVVWPMLRPDIFTGLRGPPKGILLFGPPGTGKTMIGKCIASQIKATFFSISASTLASKWVGEGEKLVKTLFDIARQKQPSVIFIDEIDSLLSQRTDNENESARKIKTEFLVQFDGVGTSNKEQILVIGATNRPHEIDEAARRRLVKRIYVPLPEQIARIKLLQILLKEYDIDITDEEFNEIGRELKGYSGSDIFNLCREAVMEPLREIDDISKVEIDVTRKIIKTDFFKAMAQIRKSVSERDLEGYEKWNDDFGSK